MSILEHFSIMPKHILLWCLWIHSSMLIIFSIFLITWDFLEKYGTEEILKKSAAGLLKILNTTFTFEIKVNFEWKYQVWQKILVYNTTVKLSYTQIWLYAEIHEFYSRGISLKYFVVVWLQKLMKVFSHTGAFTMYFIQVELLQRLTCN